MAIVGVVGRLPGKKAYGAHVPMQSGQDFNGGKRRLLSIFASELEMKHAVRRGSDFWKYLDVGSEACAGVLHHVKSLQQTFSIRANRHDAAAFSPGASGLWSEYSLGKVQTQFVDSL